MDNRPIGFFDSGIGGLTCIPFLEKQLPNEKVIYYGDTARTPYGSKSIDTIKRFSFQIADYLISHDVKMIIIACNTISATCLGALKRRHPDIPILGIVEPIANKIAKEEKEEIRIGVIGTKATVASGIYANLVTSQNKKVKLYSKACPAFVPLIEEGIIDHEIMDLTIKHYLDDFINNNSLKKIVLGCTHYPFLSKNLKRLYPNIELLNPSEEVVNEAKRILIRDDMLAEAVEPEHVCYASDLSENFTNIANGVFGNGNEVKMIFKKFDD